MSRSAQRRYTAVVIGTVSGAVISGVLFLLQFRFAEHDSWPRALTFAGIWIVFITAVMVGYQLWHDRREDRADRIHPAAPPLR